MRGYLSDVGGESWLQRRLEESGGEPNGGELIVESGSNRGTTILARIPLRE